MEKSFVIRTVSAPEENKALMRQVVRIGMSGSGSSATDREAGARAHPEVRVRAPEVRRNLLRHGEYVADVCDVLGQYGNEILFFCQNILFRNHDGVSVCDSLLQHRDDVSAACEYLQQHGDNVSATCEKLRQNGGDGVASGENMLQCCNSVSTACDSLITCCDNVKAACESLQHYGGTAAPDYRHFLQQCSNASSACSRLFRYCRNGTGDGESRRTAHPSGDTHGAPTPIP